MKNFWASVIKPVLQACEARRIIEIGSDDGLHTQRIARWCRKHGARLEAVDPLPRFDVEAFEREFDGVAKVHLALSLQVLADLLPADVVLIDGDHNWYSVFHEVSLCYGASGPLPEQAPILVCHDVGWPYGRRDLYYDPSNIPEAYRQPYRRGSLHPDNPGIAAEGMNPTGFHAETEGGPRNGVRRGLLDAIGDRADQVRIIWLDVIYGLAVVVPLRLLDERPQLKAVLDSLDSSPNWKTLAAITERSRVLGVIATHTLAALEGSFQPAPERRARPFTSSLPREVVLALQRGAATYRYKGRQMLVSPLDMANLLALIGRLRPRTVFEIGAWEGGRSLWIADMLTAHGIDGKVIAVDIHAIEDPADDRIQILRGDARDLSTVLDKAALAALPRPFLVIEDSAHDQQTCAAVLDFFDDWLEPGEEIVVEDGAIGALLEIGTEGAFLAGPSAAVRDFLDRRGEDYEIDAESCDRFGYNATGHPNGWLRRR